VPGELEVWAFAAGRRGAAVADLLETGKERLVAEALPTLAGVVNRDHDPSVRGLAREVMDPFVAKFMGRRLSYTYEVREMSGERFVMSTAEGPFPMETTYAWEGAGGGGTRMTLRNRGKPSGFARVAERVMVAAMRRANRKDLQRLKEILERGAG
jgi:hypothetical protein